MNILPDFDVRYMIGDYIFVGILKVQQII